MHQTNQDLTQPQLPSSIPKALLISYENFSNGKIPIYWGPEQITSETYVVPTKEFWATKVLMRVPKVARFMFSSEPINTDDYKPTDPPGPIDEVYTVCCSIVSATGGGSIGGIQVYGVKWLCLEYINGQVANTNNNIVAQHLGYSQWFTCYSRGGPTACSCHPFCNMPWTFNPDQKFVPCPSCSQYKDKGAWRCPDV